MYRISLFIALVVSFNVSAFASGELLTNTGFEDGDTGQFGTVTIPGWTTTGTEGFIHDEPSNVIDAKAAKISNVGTVVRQDFSVTVGNEYIFKVNMLSSSSDPLTQALGILEVRWYNGTPGSTTKISQVQVGSLNPASDPADTWKTVAGRLVAPTGAIYARIALKLNAAPTSGYCHFDNASVRQVDIIADLNDDDVFNYGDFALLASDWQQPSSPYTLDGDSDVDIDDVLILADNWLIEDPGPVGYTLVWSDEFDGTSIDTANWNHEIGGHGWGNNELQYYTDRTENSYVSGGNLVIVAREESYGGNSYTSARMTTQAKKYWTYGKMEARIKLPYGQGMWPAFWMMPENFWISGWPECGEIDIMEAINTMDWAKSSLHYGRSDPCGIHDSWGTPNYNHPGGGNFSHDFHVYSMEWEPSIFKFFVDGVQIGSRESWWSDEGPYPAPFNKPFFFILNIAVGGNWPGSPDGSTVFPQQMLVDWVRVYQKPIEIVPSPLPGQIEAEDFDPGGEGVAYHDTDAGNNGDAYRSTDVDIEACSDTGAGYNVGWIENGEWLEYTVDVTPGTYDILVRVASLSAGGSFHIEFDGVNKTGTISFPATGGWQSWTTVVIPSVTLSGGVQPMRFVSESLGYNLNYIKIQ